MSSVTVIDHPLVQHKLSVLRDKNTSTAKFRHILAEVSHLLAYEVTRDLPIEMVELETPLQKMSAPMLEGKKVCLVSILRAGNGLVEGILQLIPSARVGHVGLYRDHDTLEAVEYYFKVPPHMETRDVIIVDPMLATGNSAIMAINKIKTTSPKSLKFLCLLAAPEGVAAVQKAHPDVPIFTAAIDEKLNELGYIIPGLGDAGDRLYGTR